MNYKFNLGNINIKGKALEQSGIEQFQLENISVEISDANPMEMVQASREFFSLMKEAISYFEEKEEEDRVNREAALHGLSFPDEEEVRARKAHEAYVSEVKKELQAIRKQDSSKNFFGL